ncbi:N-acetyltransferase family protein [Actinomycetospora sp. CA-084318]|uniref:GNAT family N-acetyltransferase n=1 Tax=Actinomycetospora sp. CA-084318 TaxID=3239892 RepID=UPI003D98E46C
MGSIRPYEPADAAQVLALHRRSMLHGRAPSPEFAAYLETFYGKTLFTHPWFDDELPSLVFESDGDVLGFVAVVPRPAVFEGRPVRVASSVRFMVDQDDTRAGMAAAALHMRFVRGPQDVSTVENSNALSRRVWEGTPGTVVLPTPSVSWTVVAPTVEPSAGWSTRPADDDEMLARVRESAAGHAWQPTYDEHSMSWLMGFLESARYRGDLLRRVVLDRRERVRGWFVAYANPAGYNGVLALRAATGAAGPVLAHLLGDLADVGGSPTTVGRLQPDFMSSLEGLGATVSLGPWALAHSRDPRLTRALAGTDAYVTRLEGEFC